MINWELLYNNLLEVKQSERGERHHTTPIHDGGFDSVLVTLPRRYHIKKGKFQNYKININKN